MEFSIIFCILFCLYWARRGYIRYLIYRNITKNQLNLESEVKSYIESDCDEPEKHDQPIDRSNTKLLVSARKRYSRYCANRAWIKFGSKDHSKANEMMIRKWISNLVANNKYDDDFTKSYKPYGLKPRDLSIVIEDAAVLYWIPPPSDLADHMDSYVHTL